MRNCVELCTQCPSDPFLMSSLHCQVMHCKLNFALFKQNSLTHFSKFKKISKLFQSVSVPILSLRGKYQIMYLQTRKKFFIMMMLYQLQLKSVLTQSGPKQYLRHSYSSSAAHKSIISFSDLSSYTGGGFSMDQFRFFSFPTTSI